MATMEVMDEPTLKQVFEAGWDAQRKIEAGELSSNTDDFKAVVRDGVSSLERATLMVNQLCLFSGNESVEELPTSDLRYLLLPALLGELTLQQCEGERLEVLARARVYFVDYLQRCKSYSITEDEPPSQREPEASGSDHPPQRGGGSFEQAAADRATKIARLRAKKETEKKIVGLAERLKASCSEDSDLLREHLLATLRLWVIRSQEGVISIDQEAELLKGMMRMKDDHSSVARQPRAAAPAPSQWASRPPIVITRDMLKGKVFGAGYPSLPSMSVEQFFEQQYHQQGVGQPTDHASKGRASDDEKEEESEESLRRAREFDEYKDLNRRGAGNRKNMG